MIDESASLPSACRRIASASAGVARGGAPVGAGAGVYGEGMEDVSLFDWGAGFVLPVLQAVGTLAVAIWAGRIAKASNAIAERNYEQEREDRRRVARGKFASAAARVAGEQFGAALAGIDVAAATVKMQAGLEALADASPAVDREERKAMMSFLSAVRVDLPGPKGDVGAFVAKLELASEVLDTWVDDAAAGRALAQQRMREREIGPYRVGA